MPSDKQLPSKNQEPDPNRFRLISEEKERVLDAAREDLELVRRFPQRAPQTPAEQALRRMA